MTIRRIAIALVVALIAAALIRIYSGPIQRHMVPVTERVLSKAVLRLPVHARDMFVVLTIDDAPSSRTGEIVELLKRHNVHATFFVHTDQIAGREAAMEDLAAQGHDIGHHMPWDRKAFRMSRTEFDDEFARADAALRTYGSAAKPFFRPPYAIYRADVMDPTLTRIHYDRPLADLGSKRRYILASFIAWDAGGATNTDNPEKNRQAAGRYAHQLSANLYPGAIVVFHDGEEEDSQARLAATLYSLDQFLAGAEASGFDVVSLSEGIARAATDRGASGAPWAHCISVRLRKRAGILGAASPAMTAIKLTNVISTAPILFSPSS